MAAESRYDSRLLPRLFAFARDRAVSVDKGHTKTRTWGKEPLYHPNANYDCPHTIAFEYPLGVFVSSGTQTEEFRRVVAQPDSGDQEANPRGGYVGQVDASAREREPWKGEESMFAGHCRRSRKGARKITIAQKPPPTTPLPLPPVPRLSTQFLPPA
ncbi:hypothetical protein RhiJN_16307 [Ceratobasidium sp. AG-Ba]|nr:hypothetical protein RhiJN_16307 [Ceratobasidium sp. AG-Ba]